MTLYGLHRQYETMLDNVNYLKANLGEVNGIREDTADLEECSKRLVNIEKEIKEWQRLLYLKRY